MKLAAHTLFYCFCTANDYVAHGNFRADVQGLMISRIFCIGKAGIDHEKMKFPFISRKRGDLALPILLFADFALASPKSHCLLSAHVCSAQAATKAFYLAANSGINTVLAIICKVDDAEKGQGNVYKMEEKV